MQPRVFDPTIPAQRTARGVVSVQNTGDQPIRFGVQVRVGEDRPLVGFVSQSQAQMVTSVLVPPGQTRPVTVFIPLPEDPGSKVFVVSINQLDPAGRFVRELDTRRFAGLASVGEIPVEIPVTPTIEPVVPAPVTPAVAAPVNVNISPRPTTVRVGLPVFFTAEATGSAGEDISHLVRWFLFPSQMPDNFVGDGRTNALAFVEGTKRLEARVTDPNTGLTALDSITFISASPPEEPPTVTPAFRFGDIVLDEATGFNDTTPGTFTRGEIVFRNPRGGTNRLNIRERVLGPGRLPQTDFITHVVDPVPGVNRLRVSQLLPAAAPLGVYFLEVTVESEGQLITSRVFPNVFVVMAAPAPAVEEPAPVPTEPVVPMARPAPPGTVIAQSFRFVDPQVDALANAMMVMDLRNSNDFPALVLVRLELRPLNIPLHPVETFGFPLTLPPNRTFTFRTPVVVTGFQGAPGGVPPGTYSVALTVSDPQIIDRIVSARQFNNVLTITGAGPRAAPVGSVRPTRAQFDTPIVQAPISEPNRITIGVRNNNDFPVRQRVLASLVTARLGTKVMDFFDPTTGMTIDLEPGATVDVTRSLNPLMDRIYAGLAAGGYHVDVELRDAFTAQTVTQQRFTNVFTVRPSVTAPAQLLGAGDVFVRTPVANPTRAARGQVVLIDVDVENLTTKAGAVSVRLTLADISTIDLGALSTRLDPRGVGRVTFRWTVPTDTRLGTYLARIQVFDLDRPTVRLVTQDYSGVVSVVG